MCKSSHSSYYSCSLCSGAEHLCQVVHGAVPNAYFDSETSLHADEMTVHVFDHLFKKLNEVCLVQDGEVAESFKVHDIYVSIFYVTLN